MIPILILATTDLHMNIGSCGDLPGLARLAPVIASLRAQNPNVLLFDNGDLIEGQPVADEIARTGLGPDDIHPAIAALNALEVDAATLGNHDFAFGMDFLARALRDARYPLCLANARLCERPPLWSPTVMLARRFADDEGQCHDLRIGVFGVTPPQVVAWEPAIARELHTEDVLPACQRAITQLRAAGADLVIALSHGGLCQHGYQARPENAARQIAALDGVDAVIAGHTHEVVALDKTPAHAPIVEAGFGGAQLGAISLRLSGGPGCWRVEHDHARTLQPAATPSPLIETIAKRYQSRAEARLTEPLGQITGPIHSYYALLGIDPGLRLLAQALRAHVQTALQGSALEGLPILCALAPYRTGGRGGPGNYVNFQTGPLNRRDLSVLCPFSNCVAALPMTGAQIADWLERAATIFRPSENDNAPAALIEPDFPGFNFDLIDGLDYQIDLTHPPGQGRITQLRHEGAALDPERPVVLITNSYRLAGGPLYGSLTQGADCALPPAQRLRQRDILANHLRAAPPSTPELRPFFTLTAPPGTTRSFDTSPEATPEACPLPVTHTEHLESGFQRLTLRF